MQRSVLAPLHRLRENHIETHKNRNGKFLCDVEGCRKFFLKIENVVKHKLEAHEKTRRKRNQNEK